MSVSWSFNISTSAAMAVSEAVVENFTNKRKSLKTCLVTSAKELINIPNISDFAAFEDLSTKRSLLADLWILSSGCCKTNEPMEDNSVWDLQEMFREIFK